MTKKERKPLLTRTTYQEGQKNKKFKRKEQDSTRMRSKQPKNFTFQVPVFKKRKGSESSEKIPNKENSADPGERLTTKEQGRRLDYFYNWAISLVLITIILVFVLAFVI